MALLVLVWVVLVEVRVTVPAGGVALVTGAVGGWAGEGLHRRTGVGLVLHTHPMAILLRNRHKIMCISFMLALLQLALVLLSFFLSCFLLSFLLHVAYMLSILCSCSVLLYCLLCKLSIVTYIHACIMHGKTRSIQDLLPPPNMRLCLCFLLPSLFPCLVPLLLPSVPLLPFTFLGHALTLSRITPASSSHSKIGYTVSRHTQEYTVSSKTLSSS